MRVQNPVCTYTNLALRRRFGSKRLGAMGKRWMELTAATILVAFAGVFLIAFMRGAFGGGFAIIGIPLLSQSGPRR